MFTNTHGVSERFTAATWVQGDICGPEPWPFEDGQFDVAICSHTLEDVRDPVFVCSELRRVSRSGYVELPAAIEELTFGVQGPWAGWSHHRWIGERDGDEFAFSDLVAAGFAIRGVADPLDDLEEVFLRLTGGEA